MLQTRMQETLAQMQAQDEARFIPSPVATSGTAEPATTPRAPVADQGGALWRCVKGFVMATPSERERFGRPPRPGTERKEPGKVIVVNLGARLQAIYWGVKLGALLAVLFWWQDILGFIFSQAGRNARAGATGFLSGFFGW